jgi:predicted DNA binding CopG/RHH family protein
MNTFNSKPPASVDEFINKASDVTKSDGKKHAVTIRIPQWLYGELKTICSHTGVNYSATCLEILRTGILSKVKDIQLEKD